MKASEKVGRNDRLFSSKYNKFATAAKNLDLRVVSKKILKKCQGL